MADDDNKTPDDMSGLGLGGFIKKDANGNATESLESESSATEADAKPSDEQAVGAKKGSGSAFTMPTGKSSEESTENTIGETESAQGNDSEIAAKDYFFEGDAASAGFIFILKATFRTVFKKFWVFLCLSLLNMLLIGGLMFVATTLMIMLIFSQNTYLLMIIPVLLPVLLLLLGFFLYGTMANQVHSAYNNLEIKARQSFRQTVRLTGRAIVLALRIFVYSGLWLIVALMLLMAVFSVVMSGSGTSLMGSLNPVELLETANPQTNDDSEPRLAGMTGGEGSTEMLMQTMSQYGNGHGISNLTEALEAYNSRPAYYGLVNFLMSVAMLIILIIAMYRLVYASMAFPILMASPEHSAKEVLMRSREITNKKWWLIVCFMTIFPLILSLPGILISLLNTFVFMGDATFALVSMIIGALIMLLAYPLTIAFYQILAQELANPARRLKLNVGMLILTLLIIFSPFIIVAGSVYMLGNMMKGDSPVLDMYNSRYQPKSFEMEDFSLSDYSKINFENDQVPSTTDSEQPKVKRM